MGFAHQLLNSYCYVEHRKPKVDWCEVLVLLHKEVGPVADVEVADDDPELGEAEDEVGEVVDGEVAVPQLARPGQQPVPVVLVMVGGVTLASNLVQNHNKRQEEANTKHGERNNLEWAKMISIFLNKTFIAWREVGLSLDLQHVPSLKFMLSLQTRFSSICVA